MAMDITMTCNFLLIPLVGEEKPSYPDFVIPFQGFLFDFFYCMD